MIQQQVSLSMVDHQKDTCEEVRVLLIDLSKRFGGASVRALTLAAHFDAGFVAIAGLKDSPVMKTAQERNIPTRIVAKHRMDPLIPLRLRKIIRQDRIQIIDTQNIQSKFWGSLAALITDVAFVSTLNSSYENEQGGSLKGKLYAHLDRWTNYKTDRYIAVSVSIQQDLLKSGIPEKAVDLVTNAVQIDDALQSEEFSLTRRQIGIPEDGFVFISVGRLVWAKGYEDFIAAFASFSAQVPNAYALVLGDGTLHSTLLRQIRAAGLEKKFFLLGHCEPKKVLSILKASDVFVLSSRSEGLPFALLEAASLGLPIIATRCGGIPDMLTDSQDALLVSVGDIQAIALAMQKLYADRQLAQQFGTEARAKILREHGVYQQTEATKNVYRKALACRQLEW